MPIIAIPIDKQGKQTGPSRSFPDLHWQRLKKQMGDKLAWQEVEMPSTQPQEIILLANENESQLDDKSVPAKAVGVSTKNAKRRK